MGSAEAHLYPAASGLLLCPQPEILRKPMGSAASPLLPPTPNQAHPQKSMEFSFLRGGEGLHEGSTLG